MISRRLSDGELRAAPATGGRGRFGGRGGWRVGFVLYVVPLVGDLGNYVWGRARSKE